MPVARARVIFAALLFLYMKIVACEPIRDLDSAAYSYTLKRVAVIRDERQHSRRLGSEQSYSHTGYRRESSPIIL